jgi:hypothetical protein
MRKRHWWFIVSLALLPLGGKASATGGTKLSGADGMDVTIDVDRFTGNYFASGALGTARAEPFSSSAQKWIGCWIDASPGGAVLTCEASDSSGNDLRCASADPTLIKVVAIMNDDSFLQFETPSLTSSGVGNCTSISIGNGSRYYPKAP